MAQNSCHRNNNNRGNCLFCMNKEENISVLSKQDTNVMKGIAIIAMLCHHVYTCQPEWVDAYPIFLTTLGILGKVCVAMFLFCSGYGLAVQYDRSMDVALTFKEKICTTIRFIIKRLIKFYSAYWFVFLIFVPITIFFFDRPLSAAYGEFVNPFYGIILDLFGLQGFRSYNITWWFNRLIILFYILFPIIYLLIKKTRWIGFIACFVMMRFADKLGMLNYYSIMLWQFPFILGIGWAICQDKMNNLPNYTSRYTNLISLGILILLLLGILQRLYNIIPWGNITGVRFDGILTLVIAMFVIIVLRRIKMVYSILVFLGKHSVNIYLIHTFLNGYWFSIRKWLHTSDFCRFLGMNMWILLLLCLLISIVMEYTKERICWNKLTDKIILQINRI